MRLISACRAVVGNLSLPRGGGGGFFGTPSLCLSLSALRELLFLCLAVILRSIAKLHKAMLWLRV